MGKRALSDHGPGLLAVKLASIAYLIRMRWSETIAQSDEAEFHRMPKELQLAG